MPRSEDRPGSPDDWLSHARSDLALAEISPPEDVMLEGLCFHAQQAVEKAIKALSYPTTSSSREHTILAPR